MCQAIARSCLIALMAGMAANASASDWANFTLISNTVGNLSNRLCMGVPDAMRPADIGCPSYAPSLSTAGDVSITGNVSANKFIGDGSGLTGVIAGSSDRIVSGSTGGTRMVAVSDTGYISITQAGANSGWFDPYRGLVTLGVSATGGLSGTTGYFSGNVGIGTSTPAYPLNVQMNGSGLNRSIVARSGDETNFYRLSQVWNNGTASGMFPQQSGGLYWEWGGGYGQSGGLVIATNHENAGPLILGTAAIERMRIGTSGNVGIGTATPVATLQVSGSLVVSTSAQNTTPSLYVGTNGNVGLATSEPSSTLHIKSDANINSGSNFVNSVGAMLISNHGSGGLGLLFDSNQIEQTNTNNALYLNHNSSASTLINYGGGKVGVGTSTPLARLDVSGTISATDAIQVGSSSLTCGAPIAGAIRFSGGNLQFCNSTTWTTVGAAGATTAASSTGAIQFNVNNTLAGDTDNLFWDDANNRLGIRTSAPGAALSVSSTNVDAGSGANRTAGVFYVSGTMNDNYGPWNGGTAGLLIDNRSVAANSVAGITFWNADAGGTGRHSSVIVSGKENSGWGAGSGDYPGFMAFYTRLGGADNIERMRITSAGNVGVRTAAPIAPLHVAGGVMIGNSSTLIEASGRTLQMYAPSGNTRIIMESASGSAKPFVMATGGDSLSMQMLGSGGVANNFTIASSSNIGIGTYYPGSSLTIVGEAQVGNSGAACVAATNAGAIRYTSGNLQYCNASNAWTTLSAAGGGLEDRIVSGTTNVIAYQDRSVTISTAGTQRMVVGESGRVGIGTMTPTAMLDVSAGTVKFGGTGNASLELGMNGFGNRYAYIDLTGDATYTDFGLRVIRENTGENAKSLIAHRGTGEFGLSASEAAPIVFVTNNIERVRLTPDGNLGVGTNTPNTSSGRVVHIYNDANTGTVASNATMMVESVNRNAVVALRPSASLGGGSINIQDNAGSVNHVIIGGVPNGNNPYAYIAVSGSERMRVTSLGNIGIGTGAPGSSLTIVGEAQVGNSGAACVTATNAGAIRYTGGNLQYCNAANTWATLGAAGGGLEDRIVSGTTNVIAYQDRSITISTAGTQRMIVTENGRLGIGTTTPTATLQVSGSLIVSTSANTTPSLYVGTNGRVGVGTASPNRNLSVGDGTGKWFASVNGGNSGTDGGAAWLIEHGGVFRAGLGNASAILGGAFVSDTVLYTADILRLYSYGFERMRIDESGNVGVGTITPNAKLAINGVNGGNDTFGNATHGGTIRINEYATSLSNTMGLEFRTRSDSGGSGWRMSSLANNTDLVFESRHLAPGWTERLRVLSNGNMGIGTSTPAARLQVQDLGTGETSFAINSTIPADREMAFTTNNILRWIIGANSTAEGGSDAGSDLFINAYNDAGSYLRTSLFIKRSNGNVGIGTSAPGSSLTIVGEAQVGNSGAACVTATNAGAIRYTGGNLQFCNAANTWTTVGSAGAATAASTTGAIQFNVANALAGDTANLFWDDTNNWLGIGTSSPSSSLHISSTNVSAGSNDNRRALVLMVSGTMSDSFNPTNGSPGGMAIVNMSRAADSITGLIFQEADFGGTPRHAALLAVGKENSGWGGGSGDYPGFMAFYTRLGGGGANVERMRITSAGNVGVGTKAPSSTLHISSSININSGQNLANGVGGLLIADALTGYGLLFDSNQIEQVNTNNALHLNFNSSASTIINFGGGNVGIGTPQPVGTLHVSGSFIVSGSAQNTTPSLYVGTNGRVGIGTSTPSGTLDIAGNFIVDAQPGYYTGLSHNATYSAGAWRSRTGGPGNLIQMRGGSQSGYVGDIVFYTSASPTSISAGSDLGLQESMRVSAAGNVGIGTSIPNAALTVTHGIGIGNGTAISQTVGAKRGIQLATDLSFGGTYDNHSGYLLYSTMPGGWGTAQLHFARSTDWGAYDTVTPTLSLGGANVGINKVTPLAKLDVVGTISASDAIQVGSSSLTCGAPIAGAIRYSGGNLQYCNSTTWTALGAAGAATAASSTGAIQFNVANGLAGDTDNLFWDDTNNRLGIGTATPSDMFVISGTSSQRAMALINYAANTYGQFAVNQPGFGSGWFGMMGSAAGYGVRDGTVEVGTSGNVDLVLLTNAAERVRVKGSGNVGIGTTAPAATLQVSGSFTVSTSAQNTTPSLFVGTNGRVGVRTSSPSEIFQVGSREAGGRMFVGEDGAGRRGLLFAAETNEMNSATPYVRIHGYNYDSATAMPLAINPFGANGNVGIRMFTPLASLDVSGSISATDAIQVGNSALTCGVPIAGAIRYSGGNLQYCNSTTWTTLGAAGAATAASSTGAIQFNVANGLAGDTDNLFWDDTNNRLGIGTSAPMTPLVVSRSNVSLEINALGGSFNGATIEAIDRVQNLKNDLNLYTNAGTIKAYTNTLERLRISNSGNVGIGTQSPTATLQVSGSFTVSTSAQNTTPSLFVGTNGNVGMGTASPGHKLSVANGNLFMTDAATDNALLVATTAMSNGVGIEVRDIAFGSTKDLLLNYGGGKVGIGKTGPLAKLDVVGTISASDAIQVGQSTLTCGSQISGSIRYNTTSDTIQVCSNVGWVSLASGTTGSGSALGDRITSGTVNVIVNEQGGYVSLTNGATTWGYLSNTLSYLPTLMAARVSSTNISATTVGWSGRTFAAVAGPGGNFIASGTTSVSASNNGTIKFTTAGTERMTINGSGLQLAGWATVDYLRLEPQGGADEGGEMQFGGAGSNGDVQMDNYNGHIRLHTLASGKQFQVLGGSIYADGTSINNYLAGTLGIGTNNPTASGGISGLNTPLYVASTGNPRMVVETSAAGGGNSAGIALKTGASSNYWQTYAMNGKLVTGVASVGDFMTIDGSGNVGIGASAPSYKLNVVGSGANVFHVSKGTSGNFGDGHNATFNITQGDGGTGGQRAFSIHGYPYSVYNVMETYSHNGSAYILGIAQSNATGNVGIGAISPTVKLDVVGEIASTGAILPGKLSNFAIASNIGAGNPGINFDAGDFIDYHRASNTMRLTAGGVITLVLTASGAQVAGQLEPASTNAYNLGSSSLRWGCLYYNNSTLGSCASDARLKDKITDLSFGSALDKVTGLRPRSFVYRDAPTQVTHGLVAQEVLKVAPELVTTDPSTTYYKVNYSDLQWMTVEAIKQLKAANDNTISRTAVLEAENAKQKAVNDAREKAWFGLTEEMKKLRADNDNARASEQRLRMEIDALAAELRELKQARR